MTAYSEEFPPPIYGEDAAATEAMRTPIRNAGVQAAAGACAAGLGAAVVGLFMAMHPVVRTIAAPPPKPAIIYFTPSPATITETPPTVTKTVAPPMPAAVPVPTVPTTPVPAPVVPPTADPAASRFLADLRAAGWSTYSSELAVSHGRAVCQALSDGAPVDNIASALLRSWPELLNMNFARQYVTIAATDLCGRSTVL